MNDSLYLFLGILTMSLVTILLRVLPFLIFSGDRETPKVITYLGKVLPFAVMAMLVVYCLRGIHFTSAPFGIPELFSSIVTVAVHVLKRNTLLSILCGTVLYMVLVQLVFI